jgi:hypothetical protein
MGEPSSWLCVAVDLLHNCLELRLDFIVGEPKHSIALRLQPPRTLLIVALLFSMLGSVNLDNEPSFETSEIHDVAPQDMLSAKPAPKRAASQMLPHDPFVRGHFRAQSPRAVGHDGAAGAAERR